MLQKVQAGAVLLACQIDGLADAPWVMLSHSLACDHTSGIRR
jgi:hypothetical protein